MQESAAVRDALRAFYERFSARDSDKFADIVAIGPGVSVIGSAGRARAMATANPGSRLAAARARGRSPGRPWVMTPAKLAVARRLLDAGQRPAEVARTIGGGPGDAVPAPGPHSSHPGVEW